jgi:hypothetical protein
MMLSQSQKPRPLLPANSMIYLARLSTHWIFVPARICLPVAIKLVSALGHLQPFRTLPLQCPLRIGSRLIDLV